MPPASETAIAPEGQSSSNGLASGSAAKSNSGAPRECRLRSAASLGYRVVTMPARNVFCRILNMSAVRPRVGKIEALVDHREIRNDVSLHRFYQRRPVIHGRVLDLAAFQPAIAARTHPVNDLAAPALHRAQGALTLGQRLRGNAVRAF